MQAHPLSSQAAGNQNPVPLPFPSIEADSIANGVGLAHDAGNLLGALGLYCDLLDVPGVLRPEHLHYARELRLLSQRSGSMIARLMKGGHQLAGAGIAPRRCPAATVRALVPLLRSIAQDATLVVKIPNDLPPLSFACEVLERILVNLTRNAATALLACRTGDGAIESPVIQIELQTLAAADGDSTLRLTIADNGPGMPLAVIGAFVKPLPVEPGALRGFGHRIVRELLQLTGGRLEIVVAPGRGTTLKIDWNVGPWHSDAPKTSEKFESEASC